MKATPIALVAQKCSNSEETEVEVVNGMSGVGEGSERVEVLETVELEHAPDAAEDKCDTDEAVHVIDVHSEYAADIYDLFLDGNDRITLPTPSVLPNPYKLDLIDVDSEVDSFGWAGGFDYLCRLRRSSLAIALDGFNAPHEKVLDF